MPDAPLPAADSLVPLPLGASAHSFDAGVRLGFGIAAVAIEVARQVLEQALGRPTIDALTRQVSAPAGDAVMGAAWAGAQLGVRVIDRSMQLAAPVIGIMLEPPLVPASLQPAALLDALAQRWRDDRGALARAAVQSGQQATPVVVEALTSMVDIDRAVEVLVRQVDVDALAEQVLAQMDLTRAVQTSLRHIDIDALAEELVNQIQIESMVTQAVARVDIVDVLTRVLDELPTDRLVTAVLTHLDMESIIATALDQVDLTALVVQRVDLGALVTAALDQVELTELVIERVDLAALVTAALDRIDITAIVMERVDLPLVANTVIEEIDLAGTIRESTGSVATEAVHGARISSVEADRAVARLVDRITFRRRARRLQAPGEPESMSGEADE
ncbi:MAG: hypothetical protein PHU75_01815 [Candidatus Nanopelagicales bacterium]|nr:hypothetical protein [Candidatus Nanopelagicales bacterium]